MESLCLVEYLPRIEAFQVAIGCRGDCRIRFKANGVFLVRVEGGRERETEVCEWASHLPELNPESHLDAKFSPPGPLQLRFKAKAKKPKGALSFRDAHVREWLISSSLPEEPSTLAFRCGFCSRNLCKEDG